MPRCPGLASKIKLFSFHPLKLVLVRNQHLFAELRREKRGVGRLTMPIVLQVLQRVTNAFADVHITAKLFHDFAPYCLGRRLPRLNAASRQVHSPGSFLHRRDQALGVCDHRVGARSRLLR